ncbi:MAG: sulfite oxidase [Pseudomonadota bacterium]
MAEHASRRAFLKRLAALIGAPIVFGEFLPAGMLPVALAKASTGPYPTEKDRGLVTLNDRPLSVETPAHLLDDRVTPAERLFVRNNGTPPLKPDAAGWRLAIDGEAVRESRTFSLTELRDQFEPVSQQLVLECGGNGRHEFQPPATGNQWTIGAVGCPAWDGIRLRDVLQACGVRENAVYIGFHAADRHLSGDPRRDAISRGVPIARALEPESMLAFGMNGHPLPLEHGYPLRLVFGGAPGSTSGKWVQRISVRDRVHDGAKMGGQSYRVPCKPISPGEVVEDDALCIIEAMPVKSLVTRPQSGTLYKRAVPLPVRGHAWCGASAVARVDVSIDFGQRWHPAILEPPVNRHAWQQYAAEVTLPTEGYYEVWARATDGDGRAQPMVVPGWNPRGYLNNACHRVAIRAI